MTCPECGAAGAADDRFCETCGARLPDPRDRVEVDRPGVAGVSDRGRHHLHNEDALAVRVRPGARVAVLCDGVSSAPRPDLASAAAAEAAADVLAAALENAGEHAAGGLASANGAAAGGADGRPEGHADGACDLAEALRSAAAAAQKAVAELTADLPSGPACTFVAAVVSGGSATVGWIGDSRAYWLPDAGPGVLLTADDSWLAHTVAAGADAAVAARDPRAHSITAWLGADAPTLDVHVTTMAPAGPGTLVLCTDGLWNYHEAPTALAAELPADAACDPLGAARALVAAALRRGGRDNITVAVLPLPEGAP